jgi:hypothetical protein
MELLRKWEEPAGRPADCLERCESAAHAIAEQGKVPTQAAVATLMHVKLETVEKCYSRARTRSGRTWRETKRAAMRKWGLIA